MKNKSQLVFSIDKEEMWYQVLVNLKYHRMTEEITRFPSFGIPNLTKSLADYIKYISKYNPSEQDDVPFSYTFPRLKPQNLERIAIITIKIGTRTRDESRKIITDPEEFNQNNNSKPNS